MASTDPYNLVTTDQSFKTPSASMSLQSTKGLRPMLVGGLTAGALDLTAAFIIYGWRVPRVIAAGLLGVSALQQGWPPYVLGVVLQFFIALSAAAIYYAASRRLGFLKEHPLVCGFFYGIAVYLVMNLIVLPLSALHATGPFRLAALIQGLLVHMFLIGLPISYSVRSFSK
jgi:hypothetical protein